MTHTPEHHPDQGTARRADEMAELHELGKRMKQAAAEVVSASEVGAADALDGSAEQLLDLASRLGSSLRRWRLVTHRPDPAPRVAGHDSASL